MNIKDINPDAYRVVDQPLNIQNLPKDSFSEVPQEQQPSPTFIQRAGSVLDTIFGGGKIGEAIGTEIARLRATPEERKTQAITAPGPTAGELAGSALQSASLFFPFGRAAGAIGGAAAKAGLPLAKTIGAIGAGAIGGEAIDIAQNLQEGKTGTEALTPGIGTAIGVGIPAAIPAIKGITRIGAESLGVSTGAGYGAIKELFKASQKGGEAKKVALDALRGNTTPEQIVQEAKNALGQIRTSRTDEYVRSLKSLKESSQTYDITPIVESVRTNLSKFGVTVGQDGAIDFSRSPIRFNAEAQKDITNIIETMKDFGSRPEDATVIGLDSLKRAFDDLYSPSSQARAFVTSVKDATKGILKTVPGYEQMSSNYSSKSKLINEVQKTLSLGDKASIDSAFRKLSSVLRTNNEERKILVDELNALSDGKLIPTIAGQQLSEILPRGIARQIEGFGALGSIMAGFGAPLLKLALFASPRVVGEFVNVLGIGSRAANNLLNTLGIKGVKIISPGDRLLDTKIGKKLEKSVVESIKNPSLGLSIKDVSGITPYTSKTFKQAVADKVSKELSDFVHNAPQKGMQIDIEDISRLYDMKDIVQKRALTESEIKEAVGLLRKQGIETIPK